MNKSFYVLAVLSIVCVLFLYNTASAQVVQMGNFLNGEKYVQLNETERTLVVVGLFDMLSFEWEQPIYSDAADTNTRANMARVARCVQGKTPRQLREMLDRYLAAKPDAKRYNLASSFSAMLNTQCQ